MKKISVSVYLLLIGLLCTVPVSGLIQDDLEKYLSREDYNNSVSLNNGNYLLLWYIEQDELYMAMLGKTTGWVAIGFNPGDMMMDADIVMAGLVDDTPYWSDSFSTGPFGPHPADTTLGGMDNILNLTVLENDGWTIVEFSRKLDTGDEYDALIIPGDDMTVMWAMGRDDNMEIKHPSAKGKTIISF